MFDVEANVLSNQKSVCNQTPEVARFMAPVAALSRQFKLVERQGERLNTLHDTK